ncbi:MAG: Nif3-like dinuclear metal center hexameric protein [Candidatus Thorarchaeota archaeon]
MTIPTNVRMELDRIDKPISFRPMVTPIDPGRLQPLTAEPKARVSSDSVVEFLERRTQTFEFDYVGYEVKSVDYSSALYLMINPDPLNFVHVPKNSLVICHHKISTHNNRIYSQMLEHAKQARYNIYNFHLGWDIMDGGIMDSFLSDFGLSENEFRKVDLTYRDHLIPRLGAIFKRDISMGDLIDRLYSMNVRPSVIINPQCRTSKVGYIPGGGFVDNMMIEMADWGVDVLISSDLNWVVETVARELGMTLVEIDHYRSERHGLLPMKELLERAFPKTPTRVLENIDGMQRAPCKC